MDTLEGYIEPTYTAKPTAHLKWVDGVLFQMWELKYIYNTKIEWREVPIENVNRPK